MVARLAREERAREAQGGAASVAATSTWFGLWGDGKQEKEVAGRWVAEENVVKERMRRAQEVLDELEAPNTPLSSLFSA
ncbi:hypothetical protein ONZ43_g6087 [Nemania bipapillata]|uniref:Uncharacterized protein n=1 Tax=Nemania bipapillata TaxID=110536 RepID=A0ACC2I2R4_9PEZI|nr:hypothetical protein ONZ43_g6087 [Nemania bipapillata]